MYLEEQTMTQSKAAQAMPVSEKLHKLADSLPKTATWEDVAREVHMRARLEIAIQ